MKKVEYGNVLRSLIANLLAVLLLGIAEAGVWMDPSPTLAAGLTREEAAHGRTRVSYDVRQGPEEPDPKARAARAAKNRRYNTGGKDLTAPERRLYNDEERSEFVPHYWLRDVPLFPTSQSETVVLGTLISAQPYLSEDRSNIYTEISIRVEEIFKNDRTKPIAVDERLIVDRPGGALRLRNRRLVRLDRPNEGPGKLRAGQRYVLFAKQTHDGSDLEMVTGFEFRRGQVFGLTSDGGISFTSLRGVPSELVEEESFLRAVRQAVNESKR